ncbi:SDR family NAD(P)-dependent oxidoreductase [Nocardioides sp. Root140]|uniref:SDR family NAD(P)-dependent oxidoreductase n=1 Tax=Nocardioides sp. Root140 TaxID=1736460 RepID=UPI0009E80F7D|nr:SDR family NAD(P)-dependent oxidoreductase [Nocardioides sp. Root140]
MTDLRETFGGQTAVITGAGGGIGAALAHLTADLGMKVVIADLDAVRLDEVRRDLATAGADVLAVPTDVRDAAAVDALAEAAFDAYGSVELLVNNAGIESVGRIWETSPETWQRMQRVNADGVFHGIRSFVPWMGANLRSTYVANVASVAAVSSSPMNAAYHASKHAVLAMTECLYLEAAEQFPRMSVSVACPAAVRTRIFEDALTDAVDTAATDEMLETMRGHLRDDGITAEVAAGRILQGVADRQFWVPTHPERFAEITARRAAMLTDRTPPRANVAKEIQQRAGALTQEHHRR